MILLICVWNETAVVVTINSILTITRIVVWISREVAVVKDAVVVCVYPKFDFVVTHITYSIAVFIDLIGIRCKRAVIITICVVAACAWVVAFSSVAISIVIYIIIVLVGITCVTITVSICIELIGI